MNTQKADTSYDRIKNEVGGFCAGNPEDSCATSATPISTLYESEYKHLVGCLEGLAENIQRLSIRLKPARVLQPKENTKDPPPISNTPQLVGRLVNITEIVNSLNGKVIGILDTLVF